MLGKVLHLYVVLFSEEQYELKTDGNRDRPVRPDHIFGSDWHSVFGIAEVGNARAKSCPTTYSRFCDRRLESPPHGLFQTFLGCAVFKDAIGTALPITAAEEESDTISRR